MSQDSQASSMSQEEGESMCCEMCGRGLKNITTFLKHMNTLHKNQPRNVENPNTNLTRCEHCPKYCDGEHGRVIHMYSSHKDLISQNSSNIPTDDSDDEENSEEGDPDAPNNSITSVDPLVNIFKILSSEIQVPRHCSRDMEFNIISLIGSIVDELELCADRADLDGQNFAAHALKCIPLISCMGTPIKQRQAILKYLNEPNTSRAFIDHVIEFFADPKNQEKLSPSRKNTVHTAHDQETGEKLPTHLAKRLEKLVAKNCLSKAIQTVESYVDGNKLLTPNMMTPEIVDRLQELHPLNPTTARNIIDPVGNPKPIVISREILSACIKRLKREKALGIGFWSNELITQLYN